MPVNALAGRYSIRHFHIPYAFRYRLVAVVGVAHLPVHVRLSGSIIYVSDLYVIDGFGFVETIAFRSYRERAVFKRAFLLRQHHSKTVALCHRRGFLSCKADRDRRTCRRRTGYVNGFIALENHIVAIHRFQIEPAAGIYFLGQRRFKQRAYVFQTVEYHYLHCFPNHAVGDGDLHCDVFFRVRRNCDRAVAR